MPSSRQIQVWAETRLPHAIEILLTLWLAWMTAGLLTGGDASRRTVDVDAPKARTTAPSVERIASTPLFGQLETAAPAPVKHAVDSRLNLTLQGVMLAGAHSAAVVRLPDKRQKLVFLGERIQPGVILRAVEKDAIIVEHRGRMERIRMITRPLPATVAMRPQHAPTTTGATATRRFSRAELRAQLNRLPQLLMQARAIPHQMNGRMDGYLIQDIAPRSLYARAGLQNGDIILAVNGQPIVNPQQAMKLLNSLSSASHLSIRIRRGDTEQTLRYQIR